MQIGAKHLKLNFECVQNICNTKNHVILSNLKEKWSYERLSIIRRWVGRGGFLLPFWQVTCECVCRWGQEHQLLGRRWYQATTFYPLVEQTQTLEKMPALIPLVILLGGWDGDKEKEVVQDQCHQGGRWSQLLIYNLQLLYFRQEMCFGDWCEQLLLATWHWR